MSTTFDDLSVELKETAALYVDEWRKRGLTTPFPYSSNYVAQSLAEFEKAGIATSTVRYGLLAGLDAKKPSDEQRWKYACKIIWTTHNQNKPLDEAIDEWRSTKVEESDGE
jgi:hypothetical protein